MTDTLELSRQLNACIKDSEVYKNYQYCKDKLRQKPDKLQQLMEFRKKNYEIRLQNLSSDMFLNQKGKTFFENSLKQDIYMCETFIKALGKA